jgi:CDP-diacylglycerol--glycerol-3-phosphate 3-phosphatidyltransferase
MPLGYFLARDKPSDILICAIIIIVAGFSDMLDGFLARQLNQRSRLGLYLDPLSDKLFAIIVIVVLIFTRDFPIWLAIVIFIRDLAILVGGWMVGKKSGQIQSSQLPGKYYFTSLAVLLGSYIIYFDFGIKLFTVIVLIFYIWSSVSYGCTIATVVSGRPIRQFKDKSVYRISRIILVLVTILILAYRLYFDVVTRYLN